VVTEGFFNLQNSFKWYLRRRGAPNRELLKRFIEVQTLILAPITPHVAEEIWEKIGKSTLIVKERWPEPELDKINEEVEKAEKIVQRVLEDIQELLRVVKSENVREVALVLPARWKYDFLTQVKQGVGVYGKVQLAIREALKNLPQDTRREASKLVEVIAKNAEVLDLLVSPAIEERALRDAVTFFEQMTGLKVRVLSEEEAEGMAKAHLALPARPAIILL